MKQNTKKEKKQRISNGYILIYKPDHPKAIKRGQWQGYVYEHVIVAEKMLNRSLRDNEEVHHLNMNPSDNRPENLLILEKGQHSKIHNFMRRYDLYPIFEEIATDGHIVKKCLFCNEYIVNENKKFCNIDCRKQYEQQKKGEQNNDERDAIV
ncbi:hypothetical protein GT3570_11490 [Geobacillus thermoleovorans]|uniref:HNH endonuclease n=1 Tax=Geobacillus thermoleovorans TaxID=33941 RepID=UPI00078E5CC2|nr:hypothetical protein GT3570_11490 [Geobacillus thermoleovorans]